MHIAEDVCRFSYAIVVVGVSLVVGGCSSGSSQSACAAAPDVQAGANAYFPPPIGVPVDLQIDSASQRGSTARIVATEQGNPADLAKDWASSIAIKATLTSPNNNHAMLVFSSPNLTGSIKLTSICTGGTRVDFDLTGSAMLTPHG